MWSPAAHCGQRLGHSQDLCTFVSFLNSSCGHWRLRDLFAGNSVKNQVGENLQGKGTINCVEIQN